VARRREKGRACRLLVGKAKENRPLASMGEDNTKIDLK
jgi:hypothetical protein